MFSSKAQQWKWVNKAIPSFKNSNVLENVYFTNGIKGYITAK